MTQNTWAGSSLMTRLRMVKPDGQWTTSPAPNSKEPRLAVAFPVGEDPAGQAQVDLVVVAEVGDPAGHRVLVRVARDERPAGVGARLGPEGARVQPVLAAARLGRDEADRARRRVVQPGVRRGTSGRPAGGRDPGTSGTSVRWAGGARRELGSAQSSVRASSKTSSVSSTRASVCAALTYQWPPGIARTPRRSSARVRVSTCAGVDPLGVREALDRPVDPEMDVERAGHALDDALDAAPAEGLAEARDQPAAGPFDGLVRRAFLERAEGGHGGGHRQRVAVVRAGMDDRSAADQAHQVAPARRRPR